MKLVAFDDGNSLWSMDVNNHQKQRRLTFRENALKDNLHTSQRLQILLHSFLTSLCEGVCLRPRQLDDQVLQTMSLHGNFLRDAKKVLLYCYAVKNR